MSFNWFVFVAPTAGLKGCHGAPVSNGVAVGKSAVSHFRPRSSTLPDKTGSLGACWLFLLASVTGCLFGRPAVLHAQLDQIGDIRLADAHDRICAAPIDLHGSIGLGNGSASEHDVVDISSYFPGIFRLQNPRIPYADDLCRVQQVVKSNAQTVDGSIHCLENPVIDGKPSTVRLDGRRAGTDLHLVPVIWLRLHDELGFAPKT